MDKHYLGSFSHIDQVYQLYPSGGSYGDYIILDGTLTYWNDNQRIWGNHQGFEPISGIETQDVNGNLNVSNNLKVGNTTYSKYGVFGKIIAEQVEFMNDPFAKKNHTHTDYAERRHKHLLSDIKDLLDYVDEALSESGFSLLRMWQALDSDDDHQINISHLESVLYYFKEAFISRQNDDFANGNLTFRKKIEVGDRATFRNGAVFISNGLPEEIFDAVIELDHAIGSENGEILSSLSEIITEETTNEGVLASGYAEEIKN